MEDCKRCIETEDKEFILSSDYGVIFVCGRELVNVGRGKPWKINGLIDDLRDYEVKTKINFCPMCGRKLQ